jgi:hypothetical protein
MAAIRDSLVTLRRLLLVIGWALVLVELTFADASDDEAHHQCRRAREVLRARIAEAQRARSNEATRKENTTITIPPTDESERPNYVANQLIVYFRQGTMS